MFKRNFASFALAFVAVATAAASNVAAREASAADDGCTSLARIVEESVLQSAIDPGFANRPYLPRSYQLAGTLSGSAAVDEYCSSLVASTSEAFAKAIAQIGMTVRWAQPTAVSGHYCFSHFLSECYPRTDFSVGTNSIAQLLFVADAWKAVSTTVSQFSAPATGSDFATFNQDRLRMSLEQATQHYVMPRESRYSLPPIFSSGKVLANDGA